MWPDDQQVLGDAAAFTKGAAPAPWVVPDMSLVLYRECDGAVVLRSKVLLIAGAFPIQLLAGSRLYEPMGIGLSRAW